jgi:hypothetical protein
VSVLVLELLLVFFGAAGNVTVLFGEDADSVGGNSGGLWSRCPRLQC